MTDNKNDDNQSTPKHVIDLDAIGNTKPRKGYFNADSRVDFSLTSKQNKDRYISVGQIQELMKMPEAEKKRVTQNSLTDKHRADIKGFGKSTAESLAKLKSGLVFPSLNLPTFNEMLRPQDDIQMTLPPNYEAEQVGLLRRVAKTLEEQQAPPDPDISRLVIPRYDKRKHILTFANTPIRIPIETPAEIICNRMFRSGVPVKKPVEKGDLFELLGLMDITPKNRRVKMLYNRVDGLNAIISKATNVTDLFCFVDKKLYFNTKYVK